MYIIIEEKAIRLRIKKLRDKFLAIFLSEFKKSRIILKIDQILATGMFLKQKAV